MSTTPMNDAAFAESQKSEAAVRAYRERHALPGEPADRPGHYQARHAKPAATRTYRDSIAYCPACEQRANPFTHMCPVPEPDDDAWAFE
jgi:hypothetical protein